MPDHANSMAGKTVLVTGGIGRATAEGLARPGARVANTGRDIARTRAAAAEIAKVTANPAVDAFAAGLPARAGVRRLARDVVDGYPRLEVLVNNVGVVWARRHLTGDGLEHTFALNHLAPFLLTNLLMDRRTAPAPARIVTVSSGAQALGKIDFDDLRLQHLALPGRHRLRRAHPHPGEQRQPGRVRGSSTTGRYPATAPPAVVRTARRPPLMSISRPAGSTRSLRPGSGIQLDHIVAGPEPPRLRDAGHHPRATAHGLRVSGFTCLPADAAVLIGAG
jgi:NAD(P)-dependent dehydrogenase (short-subunit alcohol dehydrogenase family)